jgi:undecaprenyl-phosphate galactose phosphotransferase
LAYVFTLPQFIVTGYISKLFWVAIVYVFFIALEGLYTKRLPFWYEIKLLFKAITIAFVVCLAIVSIGKLTDFISRLFLFILWAYSLAFFVFFRVLTKKILFKTKIWHENAVVVGINDFSEKIRHVFSDSFVGYSILGFFGETPKQNLRYLGKIDQIKRVISTLNLNTIILDENAFEENEAVKIMKNLQPIVKNIIVLPKMQLVSILNTQVYYLFNSQLSILSAKNNLKSTINRAIKRAFDLSVSVVLTPFLILILIVIAILIKLDSKGSVFYISKRLGQNGKQFNFLKFRTMYENNETILKDYLDKNDQAKKEWELFKKLKSYDPRVTKVGRFLRKTSLDELPQLLNVLIGDMSLVGPRPYLESELERIGEDFNMISLAKPGITGLWQVSGRNELEFKTRVELDCFYVTNWSFWLDIIILFKTISVVLKQKGAY